MAEIATQTLARKLEGLIAGGPASRPLWPSPKGPLCSRCSSLNFAAVPFGKAFAVEQLKQGAETCQLCHLLWKVCDKFKATNRRNVHFERFNSILTMNDKRGIPVMSIFRGPGRLQRPKHGLTRDSD